MERFKQYLPFVFPLAAIVLVMILAVRWYKLRGQQLGQISEFAQGVEIEDLTDTQKNSALKGVGDYKTIAMQSFDETSLGEIRYELLSGKVKFTVTASLPALTQGSYQVWLKEVGGVATKKAFKLEILKGGYLGSGAISQDILPFEVVVSKEEKDDEIMEQVLLITTLEKMDQLE